MTAIPRVVFALLVAATFGAFFVAQRLKHEPTVVQRVSRPPFFSPNGDGRQDRAKLRFSVKRDDDVTVEVVDRNGDIIRTLADDRRMDAYQGVTFPWDGRDDAGRRAPDGSYRMRVTLRREGRSIVVPRSFRLDVTAPEPRILSVGPERRPTAEVLPRPDGEPAVVRFQAPGRRIRIYLYRTSPGRPELAMNPVPLPDGSTEWRWDGTLDGRRAPSGTYLVVVECRDVAGNRGTTVALSRDRRAPRMPYGGQLRGRGGITVRYLGVLPPSAPVEAGSRGDVFIDSRGSRWSWSLRRVGAPPGAARRGRGSRPRLSLKAPDGESGAYLLSVRANGTEQRVPFLVQSFKRHSILVVLPWLTWQGRNPVDDDGDGLPNLLDRGVSTGIERVFTGDGLPPGFRTADAPALSFLDRRRHRYDLTTDAALASGRAPSLRDYSGVLLAGDTRWLPTAVGRRLRSFVRDGGTLVSFGVESLRREVSVTKRGRLTDPTPPAAADLFGSRIGAITRRPVQLVNLRGEDELELFAGTGGTFPAVTAYEPTFGVGGRLVNAAIVDPGGRPVIVAARVGRGLVVRTGLPDFGSRLNNDPESGALVDRLWTLLSR